MFNFDLHSMAELNGQLSTIYITLAAFTIEKQAWFVYILRPEQYSIFLLPYFP